MAAHADRDGSDRLSLGGRLAAVEAAAIPKHVALDPQGTVRKIYDVKDFGGHPDRVLADLEQLSAQ